MWVWLNRLHTMLGNPFWMHFFSATIFWLVTGYAVGGLTWFIVFLRFFTVQSTNGFIFFVTYTMAWLTFLSILSFKRSLGWRGFIVAGAAPFGGAGLYELIQNVVGLAVYPSIYSGWISLPGFLNLSAWVALGLVGIYYWRVNRAWWILVFAYSASWVVWGLLGYQQITWGSFAQYPAAYVFNVGLKIASFVIYGLPLWTGVRLHHSSKQNPVANTSKRREMDIENALLLELANG